MNDTTGQHGESGLLDEVTDERDGDLADDAADIAAVHEDIPALLATLLADVPRGVVGGAGIYLRISHDPTGAGLGVARQLKPCLRLCKRIGIEIYDVYVDDDVSAYTGKARKDWNRMLEDVDAGNVTTLVGLNYERLSRTPRELEDVIDLHDKKGIGLATAAGTIDLGTANGRMVARMLGAAARQEVELKAERQKLANRQAAEAGKVHIAGSIRPYGWAPRTEWPDPDTPVIVEEEAEIIRDCARRILAGESRRSVCQSLNDRGILTSAGKPWRVEGLKTLLTQARLSGRREYNPREHGQVRAKLGEIVAVDVYPKIITVGQSDQLRVKLTGNDAGYKGGTGRKYLLTGILRCGRCGAGLKGRVHESGPRYQCVKAPGRGGCNRIAIRAQLVDPYVRDLICTALDHPETYQNLLSVATKGHADPDKVSEELRAIDLKREELAEAWANDEMTRREWQTARNRLDARADRLHRQLRGNEHAQALLEFARMDGDIWQRWDALPIGARRGLISACVDHILVKPTDPTKPRKRFDHDRIEPEWRT